MDLERLRYFRTVMEAESLVKASQLLFMTPGALSKSIRQLEDEIGQPLFVRTGRRLAPNAAARRLYDGSARLFEELQRLRDAVGKEAEPLSPLRIASFEVFTTSVLAELVERGVMGGVLEVMDLPTQQIERAVLDRRVDLGLTYVPYPHRDLSFLPVETIRFGIYARSGSFPSHSPREIPFAVPSAALSAAPSGQASVDSWPQHVNRTVGFRLSMLQSGLELASRGLCAVFIPEVVADLFNRKAAPAAQLERRRGPRGLGGVRQTAYLVCRVEEQEDPRWGQIRSGLRQLIRDAA